MAYLSCARCGYSRRGADPLRDPHYCPRCAARGHVQPLLRSQAPLRRLMTVDREGKEPPSQPMEGDA
ncbi:MAG: hypothetical protein ACRDNJ_04280 [Solirubrobacteraceae bacterium]